jgi:hypothetical protein
MNKLDKQYADLLQDILDNEVVKDDRTCTGKISYLLDNNGLINKIKTDDDFAKKWGVAIETIELSEDERVNLLHIKHGNKGHHIEAGFNMLDEFDIPTKLIRVTYKNETIESYE